MSRPLAPFNLSSLGARLIALSLGAGPALIGGCGPTKVTTETSPYVNQYHVRNVAVMPFENLETPQVVGDRAQSLDVPESVKLSDISLAIPTGPVRGERPTDVVRSMAAETVTKLVWDRLGAREGLTVRPLDEGRVAWRAVESEQKDSEPRELGGQVARKLGVDAVVLGKVRTYKEREGSRLGADSAAVGFEMRLVGMDGRTLWVGNYYEKQRPMNEDLWGFIERRGAFVTADELAAYGVDKVLKEFPYGTRDEDRPRTDTR